MVLCPWLASERPRFHGKEANASSAKRRGLLAPRCAALQNPILLGTNLEVAEAAQKSKNARPSFASSGVVATDSVMKTDDEPYEEPSIDHLDALACDSLSEVPDERRQTDGDGPSSLPVASRTSGGFPINRLPVKRLNPGKLRWATSRRSQESKCQREDPAAFFQGPQDLVPAIGGCQGLPQGAHCEFLLTKEVVLFEPSDREIWQGGKEASQKPSSRHIFLNTELTPAEVSVLQEFRQTMAHKEFPEYLGVHALRLLHNAKFNVAKANGMAQILLKERVKRLPVTEESVLEDLKSGFIYFHGRDRQCRPCLVIRMERMGAMAADKERAVRLVVFVLEYAIRFAMVPGRVENWVVILDLENVLSIVSLLQIGRIVGTALAIANTLETVYCGRLAWMKIVNMPGTTMLTQAVNGAIPTEKKQKVDFPVDVQSALLANFETNQLEARYGGTAPDLLPEETYPFRFFPNATGQDVDSGSSRALHKSASLSLHEGILFDPPAMKQWVHRLRFQSLTRRAVEELSARDPDLKVEACEDLLHWYEIQAAAQEERKRIGTLGLHRESSWIRRAASWLSAGKPCQVL
eukprot:TRINITY_DN11971_c1_g1_i1.p1 TRINITY_DN11971_c1_g1~~TRINITY_DN11971_c1_g1_i1.p1  ORF type:complete len:579 (-),score=110.95 TRINITY_DN11971_c1_g1_i1:216-1952(-)